MTEMQISAKGVELVAKYEGCRLDAYRNPAGVWTIGYGHTANVQEGQTLPSKEAALELLQKDLQKLVQGRSADVIAEKMVLYNKGGGKVLAGLVRRRAEEQTLFLS